MTYWIMQAKNRLLEELQRVTQEYCHSDWVPGFEHILWNVLEDDSPWLAEKDKIVLRELSGEADGWWKWQNGLVFLSKDEWEREYLRNKR